MTSKALSSKLLLVGLHFASDVDSALVTAIIQWHSCISQQSLQRKRWAHAVQMLPSKLPTKQANPPVAVKDFPPARADDVSMTFGHCRQFCAERTPHAMTKHGHYFMQAQHLLIAYSNIMVRSVQMLALLL